ncbi:hypothetical protein I317_05822 [Kwoniella heveanensis CBS 569]|nr:hypothetical protein I317_05822 [Kwoniella heveanensis CBS 569]
MAQLPHKTALSEDGINSLHDVILNYVTTAAYASTARILAESTPRTSRNGSGLHSNNTGQERPIASGSAHGLRNPGEDGTGLELGSGSGSSSRQEEGRMDIDDGEENGSEDELGIEDTERKRQKRRRSADGADIDFDAEGDEDEIHAVIGKEELESIDERRAVINHILNGSIARAVEALSIHFPAVLLESSTSSLNSSSGSNGHSYSNGHSASATTGTSHHRDCIHYAPVPSSSSSSSPTIYSHSASRPIFSSSHSAASHNIPTLHRSTYPSHVKLNLQIQQFIESFRQLSTPTNGSSPGSSSPSSSIGSLGNSGNLSNSNSSINLTHALTAAQGLHAEAKKLPADVRAVYLQEIKDVGALFAYADPENSILGGFLDQSRRIKLSEQVNAAILRPPGDVSNFSRTIANAIKRQLTNFTDDPSTISCATPITQDLRVNLPNRH